MAKKKDNKASRKPVFESESTSIMEQEICTKDPKLNMSVEAMPVEECVVEMVVDEVLIEEPMPDIAMDEVLIKEPMPDIAMDEMRTQVTRPKSYAGELIMVKPLYDVDVEDMKGECSTTCGSIPRQPRASPYTKPPVELLIGPEEIIHYVPRHLLPDNFAHNGSMKQLYLRGMDIGTGHTFIHYFHTGVYETINTEGDSSILATNIQLKQALSVYLAAINHEIPCLKELAISEMRTHASRLDLVEFLRAIGEGFQSLGPESWVQGYLQQKAKEAFEENHTVFTSEAFLDTLDNSKLNKFMMRCMAECYDEKISNMGSREEEMSRILGDYQKNLRVLSQENMASKQDNAVQHQFITPLATEPTISECCESETFREDLVSNEDFCTISCPPSEYSKEPRGCPEDLTHCSADTRENHQNVSKFPYEADSAGLMSYKQHLQSMCLAPDFSTEANDGPIGDSAAKQCGRNTKRSHHVLEVQAWKGNVSAQSITNERKEIKKQMKMRKKKERQEMRELWETMKQNRSDNADGGNNVIKSMAQPNYHDEVHKDPVGDVGGGDKRIADLEAAIALILKDVKSIQSSRGV